MLTHELASPSRMELTIAITYELKIVLRRPGRFSSEVLCQHPRQAQARQAATGEMGDVVRLLHVEAIRCTKITMYENVKPIQSLSPRGFPGPGDSVISCCSETMRSSLGQLAISRRKTVTCRTKAVTTKSIHGFCYANTGVLTTI